MKITEITETVSFDFTGWPTKDDEWRLPWYPHNFVGAAYNKKCAKCGRAETNPMHSKTAKQKEFLFNLKHGIKGP